MAVLPTVGQCAHGMLLVAMQGNPSSFMGGMNDSARWGMNGNGVICWSLVVHGSCA